MAKLMIKAIGVFALTVAYSIGAWGACGDDTDPDAGDLEVCVKAGPTYALDLFGEGSDEITLGYQPVEAEASAAAVVGPPAVAAKSCVAEGTNGPKVVIEFPAAVTANAEAEITYTVHGAVFADGIRNTDLVPMHNSGTITPRVIAGGDDGDDTVTFSVEVGAAPFAYAAGWSPDDQPNSGLAATDCDAFGDYTHSDSRPLLAFMVPPLTDAAGAITSTGVNVSVEVDPTGGGFSVFPARDQTLPDGPDAGDARDRDTGVRSLMSIGVERGMVPARGVGLKATLMGGEGTISPEMRETLVSSETGLPLKRQQLKIADVTVEHNMGVAQSDGAPFSVANEPGRRNDGDGAGVLMVTVAGDFRDGDMVFWDNGNGKYDAGMEVDTMLDMSAGMASTEFGLDEIPLNAMNNIYYVPNGKDPLRSGSIATSFVVEFSNATNIPPTPGGSRSELNYLGARDALLAYAIAPPSNPDDSNVRVRCDKSTPCQVYFACDGADGMGYFGKMDDKIGARMVHTLSAMELAEIIGADDADFAGRMSCEVIGSSISVQVLTRSGDALVNNTYVGGPLEAKVRSAITAANTAGSNAAAATAQAMAAGATATAVRCRQLVLARSDQANPTEAETAAEKAAGCMTE